jgi:butyrate kinase
MFDLEGCIDEQLRAIDKPKPTLIFPEGQDKRVLEAAASLLTFAEIVLIGNPRQIIDNLDEAVFSAVQKSRFSNRVHIIDPQKPDLPGGLLADMARTLHEKSRSHRWEMTAEQAATRIREPINLAIMLVRYGYADAVLGGLTHTSREFFLPCLRLLPKKQTVYEMALIALPDEHTGDVYPQNLLMLADVALNPEPDAHALAAIAVGTAKTMRDLIPATQLGEVNAALLSYSTRGSGEGPSVERIRAAEPLIEKQLAALRQCNAIYDTVTIDTELQASVALSETAARTKLKDAFGRHRAAGRTNILVVPYLDVGNILYHIYTTRYPSAEVVLLIGGMHDRALDFSRQSKAAEIVLGAKALILRKFNSPQYARTPNDYFFPRYRVLTINPGSTSTKLALFEGEDEVARREIHHRVSALRQCEKLMDQLPLRLAETEKFLAEHAALANPTDSDNAKGGLDAVSGRGGLLLPVSGGTYRIDAKMLDHARRSIGGEHPANLGAWMADRLAKQHDCPAFVVDPPVVDELDETARITGLEESEQEATWHALSQKAAAKLYAEKHGRPYADLNLIVAHLGGGISVGAHLAGRCVKVKNALYDGPMSPNRAGTLPGMDLIELCYSGLTQTQLKEKIIGGGGLVSYLGTADLRAVEKRIQAGEKKAQVVFTAMVEQITAEIASCVPKFKGASVDQILITGGMARSQRLRETLLRDLAALGVGVTIYPGEREMEALRDGALRVLRGREKALEYVPLRDKL